MKISKERLEITQELHALLVDYWHEVDTNWGRNATQYYTEDAHFIASPNSYKGREKIRAFYQWREDRGARTVVHSIVNFQALPDGPNRATCHWFLALYAADGLPVLPTHPPIQIARMTDQMIRTPEDGWLVESRTFEAWFQGGTPPTNPNLGS